MISSNKTYSSSLYACGFGQHNHTAYEWFAQESSIYQLNPNNKPSEKQLWELTHKV